MNELASSIIMIIIINTIFFFLKNSVAYAKIPACSQKFDRLNEYFRYVLKNRKKTFRQPATASVWWIFIFILLFAYKIQYVIYIFARLLYNITYIIHVLVCIIFWMLKDFNVRRMNGRVYSVYCIYIWHTHYYYTYLYSKSFYKSINSVRKWNK